MWRKDIEIILARQLASYLSIPIFIVDRDGNLLFYNEPAEVMLGQRFQDMGMINAEAWSALFQPMDEQERPMPLEALPLTQAMRERQPIHCDFWIRGLDGIKRHIDVTAIPLIGLAGRFVGGIAIFWEREPS